MTTIIVNQRHSRTSQKSTSEEGWLSGLLGDKLQIIEGLIMENMNVSDTDTKVN